VSVSPGRAPWLTTLPPTRPRQARLQHGSPLAVPTWCSSSPTCSADAEPGEQRPWCIMFRHVSHSDSTHIPGHDTRPLCRMPSVTAMPMDALLHQRTGAGIAWAGAAAQVLTSIERDTVRSPGSRRGHRGAPSRGRSRVRACGRPPTAPANTARRRRHRAAGCAAPAASVRPADRTAASIKPMVSVLWRSATRRAVKDKNLDSQGQQLGRGEGGGASSRVHRRGSRCDLHAVVACAASQRGDGGNRELTSVVAHDKESNTLVVTDQLHQL